MEEEENTRELELLDEIARLEFDPSKTTADYLFSELQRLAEQIVQLSFFRGVFALLDKVKENGEIFERGRRIRHAQRTPHNDEVVMVWKLLCLASYIYNRAMFEELLYLLPLTAAQSLLTDAIHDADMDLIRILLSKTQARVSFEDLCLANTPEMANTLLQRLAPGVDVHQNNDDLLYHAAFAPGTSMLEYWMDKGLDINAKQSLYVIHAIQTKINNDDDSLTPESVQCLRVLLERGADPNADRAKLLCKACKYGWKELVELLLEYGANVRARNGHPLWVAAREVRVDIVTLLLRHGARPSDDNNKAIRKVLEVEKIKANYLDPFEDRAARYSIVDMLLRHGADPNAKNGKPLYLAVVYDIPSIVRLLLEHGARVEEGNHRALREEMQTTSNDESILKMLLGQYPSVESAAQALRNFKNRHDSSNLEIIFRQRVNKLQEHQVSGIDSILDVLDTMTISFRPSSASSSSSFVEVEQTRKRAHETQDSDQARKIPSSSSTFGLMPPSTFASSSSSSSSSVSNTQEGEEEKILIPLPIIALRDIVRRQIGVDWFEHKQKMLKEEEE